MTKTVSSGKFRLAYSALLLVPVQCGLAISGRPNNKFIPPVQGNIHGKLLQWLLASGPDVGGEDGLDIRSDCGLLVGGKQHHILRSAACT